MRHPLALKPAIADRVGQLLAQASPLCQTHRAEVPAPSLRFDLRGQAAGQAIWTRDRHPELRFNLAIARRYPEDFLRQTVTHEVAHLLTAACHGRTPPHGREWQAVMRFLGIADPRRCHDYEIDESTVRRQRRWPYRCACRSHLVSTTRHRRMQRGAALYRCLHCGESLQPSAGD